MIVPAPGMVLLCHADGHLYACELFDNCEPRRMQLRCLTDARQWAPWTAPSYDPADWTVVLDARWTIVLDARQRARQHR